jgi:hypothetical protein
MRAGMRSAAGTMTDRDEALRRKQTAALTSE